MSAAFSDEEANRRTSRRALSPGFFNVHDRYIERCFGPFFAVAKSGSNPRDYWVFLFLRIYAKLPKRVICEYHLEYHQIKHVF